MGTGPRGAPLGQRRKSTWPARGRGPVPDSTDHGRLTAARRRAPTGPPVAARRGDAAQEPARTSKAPHGGPPLRLYCSAGLLSPAGPGTGRRCGGSARMGSRDPGPRGLGARAGGLGSDSDARASTGLAGAQPARPARPFPSRSHARDHPAARAGRRGSFWPGPCGLAATAPTLSRRARA